MATSVVTTAGLNVPWGVREIEGLTEVESKKIVGVWSRGVGELVVAVCFSTVYPKGLLDNSVCLAPSKRIVNVGGFLGRLLRTVGWKDLGRRCRKNVRIKRGGRSGRWRLKEAWVAREEERRVDREEGRYRIRQEVRAVRNRG